MHARDAAQTTPTVVDPGTSVADAARLMLSGDSRTVIVVEDDRVVGLLTERDIIARVVSRGLDLHIPVGLVMTPDPVTLPASESLISAYAVMREHGLRRLPLLEGERLAGLLLLDDLTSEVTVDTLTTYGHCPSCGGGQLRPVSDGESSNLLCLGCRHCWRPERGELVRVDPVTCPGCPDRMFCQYPTVEI